MGEFKAGPFQKGKLLFRDKSTYDGSCQGCSIIHILQSTKYISRNQVISIYWSKFKLCPIALFIHLYPVCIRLFHFSFLPACIFLYTDYNYLDSTKEQYPNVGVYNQNSDLSIPSIYAFVKHTLIKKLQSLYCHNKIGECQYKGKNKILILYKLRKILSVANRNCTIYQ